MHRVNLNGVDLEYNVQGAGEPVLLIHGSSVTRRGASPSGLDRVPQSHAPVEKVHRCPCPKQAAYAHHQRCATWRVAPILRGWCRRPELFP